MNQHDYQEMFQETYLGDVLNKVGVIERIENLPDLNERMRIEITNAKFICQCPFEDVDVGAKLNEDKNNSILDIKSVLTL